MFDADLFYETTNKEEAEMDVGIARAQVSGLPSAVGMAMLPCHSGNVLNAGQWSNCTEVNGTMVEPFTPKDPCQSVFITPRVAQNLKNNP